MRNSVLTICSLVLLMAACVAVEAQARGPLMLQTPTVSRTHVAFAYADDIWIVERQGGEARRLTTHAARERSPVFSPDGSVDKQGIIVDGRFNEGGRAADYIIDTLKRVPLQRAALRDGADILIPAGIINGQKVLLTNEMAGSGGDSLPWMWQQTKLGPVVGIRTGGAGVGASTHQLIDGGSFRIPDWGWYDPLKGTWLMENRGVAPDYEVEITPADWQAGRDTQLEKAVQLALEALKKRVPMTPKRPAYPVYKQCNVSLRKERKT